MSTILTNEILGRLPIAIYSLDLDGILTATNAAGAEIFGADTPEAIVGRPFITLLGGDDWDRVVPQWQEALSGEEVAFDTKSSAGQPIFTHFLPVRDGSAVVRVVAYVDRRGESEALAKRLRQSEARQRLLLSRSPDVVFAQDVGLRYTFVLNPPVGLKSEQMVGRLDGELFDAKTAGTLSVLKQSVLKDGKPRELDVTLGAGEGDGAHYYRMVISAERDATGQTHGIIGYARDVGIARKAEIELEVARRQLLATQKHVNVGIVASALAKDFADVLVSIQGNASHAQSELTKDHPAAMSIGKLLEAVQQATDLTRQLIGYTSEGAKAAGPVHLTGCIREFERLLRTSVSGRATLQLELDEDMPRIELDSAQLQQIVMTLVLRAAEAFGEGRGTITVRTRGVPAPARGRMSIAPGESIAAGAHVVLEVVDDGPGISPDAQREIFDPDGPYAALAAMRSTVRAHRGSVQVSTTPGEGTTFRVLFPVDTPSSKPSLAPPRPSRPDSELRGQGIVLIADSDAGVRATAGRTLIRYGYRILFAQSGADAIETCAKHRKMIRGVLTEAMLPDMEGPELVERLREIHPGVAIVLSSGYAESVIAEAIELDGATRFIQKPYDPPLLAETLRNALDAFSSRTRP